MLPEFLDAAAREGGLPLWLVTESDLPGWLGEQPAAFSAWVRAHAFQAERHRVLPLPGADGTVAGAVLGLGSLASPQDLKLWHAAGLSERLPPFGFRVAAPLSGQAATHLALGWLLGGYRFAGYRAAPPAARAGLAAPPEADHAYVRAAAEATALARDLINTPANDLGPAELAQAATEVARQAGAACSVIEGDDIARDFPLIHAVGKASPREPRLIDLRWGRAGAPRVTLVGKGICFDTGGLDVKPSAGMLLMKKDIYMEIGRASSRERV